MPVKPLYHIVDRLYHVVMDRAPKSLQDREMASAFTLGGSGSYGAARLAQLGLRLVANAINPELERGIPALEIAFILGLPAITLLYSFRDPRGIKETVTKHPTYISGMLSAYLGGTAASIQDIANGR